MDLELLRSLIVVAERESITEASRVLGVTQSALSRRIQQLEEALGASLLERSRRGVALTELGRLAVGEGRVLLERLARLRGDIAAHLRHDVGSVRVGGGATAASLLLPPAIARFRRRHPGVLFQLKEAGSREVEADVAQERLELGIVTLPTRDAALEVLPLCDDRIVLIAGRDHPLARARRLDVKALHEQDMVGFEADSAIRRLIDGALRDAGVTAHVVMELRSIAAILRMVALTHSLAFVSELGLRGARGVRVLPVRRLAIVRSLAVIHKRGRPLSPAASAFLELLRGEQR
ncbi:MAG: LysR family transcriptional regulator [Myxococcales bacterium]|nr:LysR family transcriptional regulator [Myxococcales bacterium]